MGRSRSRPRSRSRRRKSRSSSRSRSNSRDRKRERRRERSRERKRRDRSSSSSSSRSHSRHKKSKASPRKRRSPSPRVKIEGPEARTESNAGKGRREEDEGEEEGRATVKTEHEAVKQEPTEEKPAKKKLVMKGLKETPAEAERRLAEKKLKKEAAKAERAAMKTKAQEEAEKKKAELDKMPAILTAPQPGAYPSVHVPLVKLKTVAGDVDKPKDISHSKSKHMIEVILNDRLGKKVRVKCNNTDTVLVLKKLAAAQLGTRYEKLRIQKWYNIYKDHISLMDYEVHDGMGLELYYM